MRERAAAVCSCETHAFLLLSSADAGLKGFFGILSFVAVNSLIVFLYSTYFNDETEEDMMEFVKEGFMTAFASFMVAWILTYTCVFHPHIFASGILRPPLAPSAG